MKCVCCKNDKSTCKNDVIKSHQNNKQSIFHYFFQDRVILRIIRVTYRRIFVASSYANQGLSPAEVYIAVNLCSDCICSLGYEVPGHGPPDINCRCYCLQRSQIPAVSLYSPPCLVCLHRSSLRSSLIDRMEWIAVYERERGSIVLILNLANPRKLSKNFCVDDRTNQHLGIQTLHLMRSDISFNEFYVT